MRRVQSPSGAPKLDIPWPRGSSFGSLPAVLLGFEALRENYERIFGIAAGQPSGGVYLRFEVRRSNQRFLQTGFD